jgi:hypothetical protein
MNLIDEAGIRVVAISHLDERFRCYLYGHGTYEGLFVLGDDSPSEPRKPTDNDKLNPFRNPRIRLDSGEYVWGNMCWWVKESEYDMNPPAEEIYVDVQSICD